jgi:uncharacterized protein (TIGR02246 family)
MAFGAPSGFLREARSAPEKLYRAVIECWNRRDAAGFAELFEAEGHCIGFGGTEMPGPDKIESTLGRIFAEHETATYVAKVRDVRLLTAEIALLRAVVGDGAAWAGRHQIRYHLMRPVAFSNAW